MLYTVNLFEQKGGIQAIIEAAEKFNIQRFVYAVHYKHINEPSVEKLGQEVATYRKKMEEEYNRLLKFSATFNKEFVTSDNGCFDTNLTLLRKLRSGISETKRIFSKFCPRARRDSLTMLLCAKPVSAYEYAYISSDEYQLDLFKLEGYPPCVSGLYNEMERFFVVLIRSMQLCQQVLKEECEIRNDHDYCLYLYEQFKEKIQSELGDFLMMFIRNAPEFMEENNTVIACRNHYESDAAWAPFGFHNGTVRDTKHLVAKQLLDDMDGNDLTPTEILLFGKNEKSVHWYRHVISHFDELLPEGYHNKKLPAKMVMMLLTRIGIKYPHEKKALEYFNGIYGNSSFGKYETVSYQAINTYKKEIIKDKDGCYTKFVDHFNDHFHLKNQLPKAV